MLKLKISKKGELVIPKKIREHLGLSRHKQVIVEIKENSIEIKPPPEDIVKRCEARAKKWNADPSKLIYGDKLYEEIF